MQVGVQWAPRVEARKELEGTETRSAEDEIRRARETAPGSRTRFVPANSSKGTAPGAETPANPRKADARTRTGDPFITSEVLYQLSYVGTA